MSTSGQGGTGGERPQGLAKFMRRASKVLKGGSTRSSVAGASDIAPTASEPAPSQSTVTRIPSMQPAASQSTVTRIPSMQPAASQSKRVAAEPTELPITSRPIASASAHNKLQEEKARALFAKWGLTLEPGEWTPVWKGDAGRVERQVRMRVHRQCHRCQTTFGPEKICNNCTHTRCKKCPRFPTKKTKEPQSKALAGATTPSAANNAPYPSARTRTKSLALPDTPMTGNEVVVRKAPVQRVRRTCHKCNIDFIGKATTCKNCQHLRCPKCPREPPKLKKHPHGYPGDTIESFPLAERSFRPQRTRTRFQCHQCQKFFLEHEYTCAGCSHERCAECPRHPPKKVRQPVDQAVVRGLGLAEFSD